MRRISSKETALTEASRQWPAIAVIAKLEPLKTSTAANLYRLAIDTGDPAVRFELFGLLVRAAGPRFQGKLFEIAVNPARGIVRMRPRGR